MPEGPFGGPRPFAEWPGDHITLYTSNIQAQNRVVIPSDINEQEDIDIGDLMNIDLYHMPDNKLNRDPVNLDVEIVSGERFTIPQATRKRLETNIRDRVLVVIKQVFR